MLPKSTLRYWVVLALLCGLTTANTHTSHSFTVMPVTASPNLFVSNSGEGENPVTVAPSVAAARILALFEGQLQGDSSYSVTPITGSATYPKPSNTYTLGEKSSAYGSTNQISTSDSYGTSTALQSTLSSDVDSISSMISVQTTMPSAIILYSPSSTSSMLRSPMSLSIEPSIQTQLITTTSCPLNSSRTSSELRTISSTGASVDATTSPMLTFNLAITSIPSTTFSTSTAMSQADSSATNSISVIVTSVPGAGSTTYVFSRTTSFGSSTVGDPSTVSSITVTSSENNLPPLTTGGSSLILGNSTIYPIPPETTSVPAIPSPSAGDAGISESDSSNIVSSSSVGSIVYITESATFTGSIEGFSTIYSSTNSSSPQLTISQSIPTTASQATTLLSSSITSTTLPPAPPLSPTHAYNTTTTISISTTATIPILGTAEQPNGIAQAEATSTASNGVPYIWHVSVSNSSTSYITLLGVQTTTCTPVGTSLVAYTSGTQTWYEGMCNHGPGPAVTYNGSIITSVPTPATVAMSASAMSASSMYDDPGLLSGTPSMTIPPARAIRSGAPFSTTDADSSAPTTLVTLTLRNAVSSRDRRQRSDAQGQVERWQRADAVKACGLGVLIVAVLFAALLH